MATARISGKYKNSRRVIGELMGATGGLSKQKSRSSSLIPDCPICIVTISDKAFVDPCMHQFCFPCLKTWSKENAVCPLCMSPFRKILHNIRRIDDYDTYDLVDDASSDDDSSVIDLANTQLGHVGRERVRGSAPPQAVVPAEVLSKQEQIRAFDIRIREFEVRVNRLKKELCDMNLRFYGFQPTANEDCFQVITSFITDVLGLPSVEINRAYRYYGETGKPIVAQIPDHAQRDMIMSKVAAVRPPGLKVKLDSRDDLADETSLSEELLTASTDVELLQEIIRRQGLRLEELTKLLDYVDSDKRRNNLCFYNLVHEASTNNNYVPVVKQFVKDILKIEGVTVIGAVRMEERDRKPIVATIPKDSDITKIMGNVGKLKGTRYFVQRDFTDRVLADRAILEPMFKQARQEGKRVIFTFDHLYMDGKRYYVGEDNTVKSVPARHFTPRPRQD